MTTWRERSTTVSPAPGRSVRTGTLSATLLPGALVTSVLDLLTHLQCILIELVDARVQLFTATGSPSFLSCPAFWNRNDHLADVVRVVALFQHVARASGIPVWTGLTA